MEGFQYQDIGAKMRQKHGRHVGGDAISKQLKKLGCSRMKKYVRPWTDGMDNYLMWLCVQDEEFTTSEMAAAINDWFNIPFDMKTVRQQVERVGRNRRAVKSMS